MTEPPSTSRREETGTARLASRAASRPSHGGPSHVARDRRYLFAAACAAIFVFGVVLAILGTLFGLPGMRERLQTDLAQQGDIFLALFLGVLVSTLVAGPIIESAGHKGVFVLSAGLVAAALAGMAAAGAFGPAALAAFVLGFGGGGLNTGANALVADIYPDNRGPMLAILGTFFGFGALVIPLVAASLTGRFSITELLLASGVLPLACALLSAVLRFPAVTELRPSAGSGGESSREREGFSLLASIKAARIPGVLLFAAVLFFQSGNESAIGGWTSTYAGAMGASARTATWILAAYWAALMVGRVLAARAQKHLPPATLVRFSGIGSATGGAMLLLARSVPAMILGAIVVGLSFAAIYPTTLAMAADRYERLAGTIFGLLFAIGLVGGMVFPWAIGHLSSAFGLRAAMALPIAGGAAIAVLAGALSHRAIAHSRDRVI